MAGFRAAMFVCILFHASIATLTCESNYSIGAVCVPTGVSPLEFYVRQPDPDSTYDPRPMQTLALPPTASGCSTTAYVLSLTSQRWMSDDILLSNSSARSLWRHQLSVVVPDACHTAPDSCRSTAWLYVTGGHNPLTPLSPRDGELLQAAELACAGRTIGAVLKQVPNQPVIFRDELPHPPDMYPGGERSEDGIIAYGWRRFLDARAANRTADARWLLRLPMTKAVSRAMDAVTDFAARDDSSGAGGFGSVRVADFVVGGASKRGWTTWATGLAEPGRLRAIVPIVEDLLDLQTNSERTYQALGGWTFEYTDYVVAGLVGPMLRSPAYGELASIVDPYAYIASPASPRWRRVNGSEPWLGERMAKLVVNAGNDEFFLPNDNHLWWRTLAGEKHLLHLPNADHGFNFLPTTDAPKVFEAALVAFFAKVVSGAPREAFTWQLASGGGAATITVGNMSSAPTKVVAWAATTTDGQRDWRLYNCRSGPGANCTQPEAEPSEAPGAPRTHPVPYSATPLAEEQGSWRATVAVPTDGNFTAFVVSVHFASGEHFTSQMQVAPDVYPFEPCTQPGAPPLAGGCDRLV